MPRGHYPRQSRIATWTSVTEDTLRIMDDFLSMQQIVALTGGASNQISAALYSLKMYLVVDCVISEGQLFWFLTGLDTRVRVVEERTPEDKPRKTRRRKAASPELSQPETPTVSERPLVSAYDVVARAQRESRTR